MLIFSQNRKAIINCFDYLNIQPSEEYLTGKKMFSIYANFGKEAKWLGNYFELYKAQDVFYEIMKKAEVGNRVYYMPEE